MRKQISSLIGAITLGAFSIVAHAVPFQVFEYDNGGFTCTVCSLTSTGSLFQPVEGYATLPGFEEVFIHADLSSSISRVDIQVSNLPAHNVLSLDFLLAIIDSWDGSATSVAPDFFNVEIDGVSVFRETYDNFDTADQSAPTSNQISFGTQLGFNSTWNDSAYDMSLLSVFDGIAHTANSVSIVFFANGAGWQGGFDESFALDNIVVTVDTVNGQAPEPATLVLMTIGLAGIGFARKREKS